MDTIVARRSARPSADRPGRPRRHRPELTLVAAICAGLLVQTATADDLDVYRARIAAEQRPNVLFVLDYSGSMQQDSDGNDPAVSGKPARIDQLKSAVTQVIDANLDAFNVGIGSVFQSRASGVRWPTVPLTDEARGLDAAIPAGVTNRDVVIGELERLGAGGATSTVNGLAEAAAYFRGAEVRHGDSSVDRPDLHAPDTWDPATGRYGAGNAKAALTASYTPSSAYRAGGGDGSQEGVCNDFTPSGGADNCAGISPLDILSCETRPAGNWEREGASGVFGEHEHCRYRHPDAWSTPSYVSPVGQCQANAIILISDGVPTSRNEDTTLAEALNAPIASCEDLSGSVFGGLAETTDEGNCGPEIAERLAAGGAVPGQPDATIETYAIAFNTDRAGSDYLQRIATAGNGQMFEADSEEALVTALTSTFDDLGRLNETFAELAVDVDRANFAHEKRAYFNLFEPSRSNAWRGNLKGYFLSPTGLVDVSGAPATEMKDGVEVFASTARSFWSGEVDGNDPYKGGASEQITGDATENAATASTDFAIPAARKLYTWLGAPPSGAPIDITGTEIVDGNAAIDASVLGLPDDSRRTALIEALHAAPMGDPLHSRSVALRYDSRKVMYTMTNQGLLHAFDATRPIEPDGASPDTSGGEELWAFMPKRLLANLPALFDGVSDGDHVYGLDGGSARWHDDSNGDGIVNGTEKALLVFGMRRGGNAYFALDVSEPERPKLAWQIDASTPGFERLGETWSRPALVRSKSGTDPDGERFLVFGGGYDAAELDDRKATRPSRGNALFVVDRDGDLVWSVDGGDVAGMKYAIPSDPTVVDLDADGFADRLYTGDHGGQVWRVDFADMRNAAQYRVTRLASLANGKHRSFFYAPSVAMNVAGGERFLSVSLGSGDRTDPLEDKTADAFFMIRDTDIDPGPPDATFDMVRHTDLFDATDNAIGDADGSVSGPARDALAAARGWRIDLSNDGEKALARPISFEGKLLATTFEPGHTVLPGECGARSIGRYYQMDIATGQPVGFANDAPDATASRYRTLNTDGIPSAPVVLFPDGATQVKIVVGKEIVERPEQDLKTVFWHAR